MVEADLSVASTQRRVSKLATIAINVKFKKGETPKAFRLLV